MRIISLRALRTFWKRYPDAEQPLKAWLADAARANRQTPHEIKQQYRNASVLKNRRVVFNIKGNDYRLVVAIGFRFGAVYVKFIGTHEQYDAVDAETIEPETPGD